MLDDVEDIARKYITWSRVSKYAYYGVYTVVHEFTKPKFTKFIFESINQYRPVHLFDWPKSFGDKYKKQMIAKLFRKYEYYNKFARPAIIFLYKHITRYNKNLIKQWVKNLYINNHGKFLVCILKIILATKIRIKEIPVMYSTCYNVSIWSLWAKCLDLGLIKRIDKNRLRKFIIIMHIDTMYSTEEKDKILQMFDVKNYQNQEHKLRLKNGSQLKFLLYKFKI